MFRENRKKEEEEACADGRQKTEVCAQSRLGALLKNICETFQRGWRERIFY